MQTDAKVGSKPRVGETGKERSNKLGLKGLGLIHLFFFFTYRRKNIYRDTQKEAKKKKKEKKKDIEDGYKMCKE